MSVPKRGVLVVKPLRLYILDTRFLVKLQKQTFLAAFSVHGYGAHIAKAVNAQQVC